jgi:hypothetical protein
VRPFRTGSDAEEATVSEHTGIDPELGTAEAHDRTQDPPELQQDTTSAHDETEPAVPAAARLSERQRTVLFRLLRVAYPHDRFPDGPYERTATQVEAAAGAGADTLAALAAGLDALDANGDFTALDEAAATAALEKVEREPFFRQIHATTVVALYDDREVWRLLGYEGSSFEQGGYLHRGFDDLDWLPEARIAELDEARVELVDDAANGGRS